MKHISSNADLGSQVRRIATGSEHRTEGVANSPNSVRPCTRRLVIGFIARNSIEPDPLRERATYVFIRIHTLRNFGLYTQCSTTQ